MVVEPHTGQIVWIEWNKSQRGRSWLLGLCGYERCKCQDRREGDGDTQERNAHQEISP
jgi:hypothetical protein